MVPKKTGKSKQGQGFCVYPFNYGEYVRQGGLRIWQNYWRNLPTEPPPPNARKLSEIKKGFAALGDGFYWS